MVKRPYHMAGVYEWDSKFSEGLKEVLYLPHAAAVCIVNILWVRELMLGNR
jgi:hypothetical protein